MNTNVAYYSSVGKRKQNEDTISLLENNNNIVAVVADGLGGEGSGDIASLVTIKTITGQLAGEVSEESIQRQIKTAIVKANEEIIRQQNYGCKMKSTVAVLYISNIQCFAANVGDTRIYQFRNNNIVYQSIDHSVAQMSVSTGIIKACEIRGHIDRNRLTKALGSKTDLDIDIAELFSQNGDAFLLCSDGFWEYVLEDEMCEDLKNSGDADEWLRKMRNRVETRISPTGDNHSAIAIITERRNVDYEHGLLF